MTVTSYHSLIIFWPIAGWILGSIPAYVIGQRLGVVHSGEAFIPIVGPYIVLLHSIKRSGWLCILGLIPFVSLIFYIWLICVIPVDHGRTRWWILAFLIPLVNVIAYYAYAFTIDPYGQSRRSGSSSGTTGGFGSTYHVPPAYKQPPR